MGGAGHVHPFATLHRTAMILVGTSGSVLTSWATPFYPLHLDIAFFFANHSFAFLNRQLRSALRQACLSLLLALSAPSW